MRILLVSSQERNDAALEEALRAVGADVTRGPDIEAAVEASVAEGVDAVLVSAKELARLSRGPEQISSWLRHGVMNALATVLGYAQLLVLNAGRDPAADRARLEAIAERALLIRELVDRGAGEETDA